MNGANTKGNDPSRNDEVVNQTSPKKGMKNQALKPQKPMLSPQPPRVMSAKERKRLMQSRRTQNSQQSVAGNDNGNPPRSQLQQVTRKRRRSTTPIPELNDSFFASSSRMLAQSQQSHSSQSQSTRYYSGNSQSQTSGSLFANLGGASQSTATSNNYNAEVGGEQSAPAPAPGATSKLRLSERQRFGSNSNGEHIVEESNIARSRSALFEMNDNETNFKSPNPNLSGGNQKTPSSLFGEIMKRTHWELNKDEVVESSNAPPNLNGGEMNDFASALDLEGKKPLSALHPPPVLRTMSSLEEGYDNQHERAHAHGDGKRFAEHTKSIQMPSSTHFSLTSLMPSLALAPRRKNIFKQWSKSSTHAKTVEATKGIPERDPAPLFAGSPPRKARTQSHTSPSVPFFAGSPSRKARTQSHTSPSAATLSVNRKSQASDYGTPIRSKQDHHVAWDHTATPTHRGALFRRSPKTPDESKYRNHKTPPRSKRHVNWDPRTPDAQKKLSMTPNGINRYYTSPGGFALQRVLDGCMSPHLLYNQHLDFDEKKIEEPLEDQDGSRSSVASLTGGVDDWKECWLRVPSFVGTDTDFSPLVRGEVGFVDWSIKCNVRIECNPSDCIPGKPLNCPSGGTRSVPSSFSFAAVSDHNKIEEMAMDIFTNPDKGVQDFKTRNAKEKQDLVLAQWKAALMYWQYPSAHPLPCSFFPKPSKGVRSLTRSSSIDPFRGSNSKLSSGGGLKRQQSLPVKSDAKSQSAGSTIKNRSTGTLANSVIGKEARLRQSITRCSVGSLGGLGESKHDSKHVSTTNAMLQQRRDEWQECFRGLFFKWNSQIHELNAMSAEDAAPVDSSISSRSCFYSISTGRTVLFRPALSSNNKNGPLFEPLIVISSSTKTMRSFMGSMGIRLQILSPNNHASGNQYDDVTDMVVDQWLESDEIEDDLATNQVHQELEALRRATAHESVGAEVSISMFQKRKPKASGSKSPSIFPPLIIRGHDDCMSFYELFLNSYGSLMRNTTETVMTDVPLLVSRSLGPTKNMSLRHLASSVVQGRQQEGSTSIQQHQLSSVDLHGPIFPCSVRDITCASAAYFSLHKKLLHPSQNLALKNNGDDTVDENILGSHYFMMQLRDHSGKETSTETKKSLGSSAVTMGSAGSFCFNGLVNHSNQSNEMGTIVEESRNGEVTSMAVWDVNRPLSIAYKSSKIDESLFQE